MMFFQLLIFFQKEKKSRFKLKPINLVKIILFSANYIINLLKNKLSSKVDLLTRDLLYI